MAEYKDKTEAMTKEYTDFIAENRHKVNQLLNRVLWLSILVGPALAIGILFGVFTDISYATCILTSMMILGMANIHYLMVKNNPDSQVVTYFSLIFIEAIVVFMCVSHIGIYLTYFIVPLLSLLFCDRKVYIITSVFCFVSMILCNILIAPFAVIQTADPEMGAVGWFFSMTSGFVIEYTCMFLAGLAVNSLINSHLKTVYNNISEIQEQTELKQEAESASRAKSSFLANMSHEIRTPINAVLGMNEMILRESKDENILTYSRNIRGASRSLLGLINDILDFSKIEAGKLEIIPTEYAFSSMINDIVNLNRPRMEDKGLEFVLDVDKSIPEKLFGDEIRIKQVITNLLSNAAKYTDKGSVTLKITGIKAGEDVVSLHMSVKDTGIGIKREEMYKLFEAFERLDEKRNRTVEGTGLGIAITSQLLAYMDSQLQVESEYGVGSEFYFDINQHVLSWVPMGDISQALQMAAAEGEKYRESFRAPDARILVVDDAVMNLSVIKGLLKNTQIQIDTAESGFVCLECMREHDYDLVFLDHRMPRMDGIETMKKIVGLPSYWNKKVPVIALTANALSGAKEVYLNAGFTDYLAKPVDPVALENMLITYLPPEKITRVMEEKHDDAANLPVWLYQIEQIDPELGLAHCGNLQVYMDTLKDYARKMPEGLEEIRRLFEIEEWRGYTIKVHALKSTSALIGAMQLSRTAEDMENAGNTSNADLIRRGTPLLLENYERLGQDLAAYFEEAEVDEEDDERPEIGSSELKEALEAINMMADSFDYDGIKEVLDSLKGYKIPEEEKDRYTRLQEAVEDVDWEKIKEIVR